MDDTTEDSTMIQLADEVEATLVAHGLAVERAKSRGLAERRRTATGEVRTPRDLDERREAVLVAVRSRALIQAAQGVVGSGHRRCLAIRL